MTDDKFVSSQDLLENIQFSDLFQIEEIQKIQDLFAESMGVASLILTTDGIPITKPSNFCDLCMNIIRKNEKGLTNCIYSDTQIGNKNPNGWTVQQCLSGGLYDAGVSIIVEVKHIANWLIGQVRDEKIDIEKVKAYADEIGADKEVFNQALEKVPVMSVEKFKDITQILFLFVNQVSQKAYLNLYQKELIKELEERELHLEKEVDERTKELVEKNNELERYNKLFEGREFRIKELRDKVKELENKLRTNSH